jgi:hypothetical protein
MLQELTNKIKNILKDKEWTRLSLLEHGLKEYPEGYEHYEDVDITLEDVLRCLAKNGNGYFVDCKGRVNNLYDDKGRGCFDEDFYYCNWQLGKPLHEQSEETIKELNKLI